MRITYQKPTASGRRTGWAKHVTGVDQTKTNGYAFEGEFLDVGESDLPLGAIVVEQYPTGSVRNGNPEGRIYRVTDEGLREIDEGYHWREQFLSLRDAVAKALSTTDPDAERKAAIAEIKRLSEEYDIGMADLL